VIYTQRRQILEGISFKEDIIATIQRMAGDLVSLYILENQAPEEWDIPSLVSAVKAKFGVIVTAAEFNALGKDGIAARLEELLIAAYEAKEKAVGEELMRYLERTLYLQIIDSKWKEHLYTMDSLREGIGLRAYGQRDPLIEYKREAFGMFTQTIGAIEEEAVELLFKLQPAKPAEFRGVFSSVSQEFVHREAAQFENVPPLEGEASDIPISPGPMSPRDDSAPKPIQHGPKVGRNDPCPCGSGKKYKKCCGR
jgi:preprotein translocase subunit SecA